MTAIENSNINELTEEIRRQRDDIKEITDCLKGGRFNEGDGLIQRMEAVEKKQDATHQLVSQYQNKWAGVVWVAIVIGGAFEIGYFIITIFKK